MLKDLLWQLWGKKTIPGADIDGFGGNFTAFEEFVVQTTKEDHLVELGALLEGHWSNNQDSSTLGGCLEASGGSLKDKHFRFSNIGGFRVHQH